MNTGLENRTLINGVIAAVILISAVPSAFYIIMGSDGLELASIIVSGGLSVALVVLYIQQQDILEKQAEMMNRDLQSVLSLYPQKIAEENDIQMRIRNEGRGKVRRMLLKSEITSDTGDLDVSPAKSLVKSDSDGSVQVPSESEREEYHGEVRLLVPSFDDFDDSRRFPFSVVSRALSGQGIQNCTLKLTLLVFDESVSDDDFSYDVHVAEQELQLNDPIRNDSEETQRYQMTTVEDGIEMVASTSQDIDREWL